MKQKAWFKMFSRFIRDQTYRVFSFLHISLGISFPIKDLVRTTFHALPISNVLVYRFHGDIDCLENHNQPNFNSFPKNTVIFTSIRLRKGW